MRVYCPAGNIRKERFIVYDRSKVHYLLDVLRLKNGDSLDVFDGVKEYKCLVDKADREKISARIISSKKISPQSNLEIALACAIPKKSKMDYIVEKCTELGVARLIPMLTERTVARPKVESINLRLRRWRRISEEASRQSGRINFPVIEPALDFGQAIHLARNYQLALIPNLGSGGLSLKQAIGAFIGRSVIVFIGPEGDFSQKEINLAKKEGCIGVSLGELVLKVDTAAIAAVSMLYLNNS